LVVSLKHALIDPAFMAKVLAMAYTELFGTMVQRAKLGVMNTDWVTVFCFDDDRLAAP